MSNVFLFDYYCLGNVSLPEWNDSFFWPVGRDTTQEILSTLVNENTRIVNELGHSFEGDCFLIYNQTWNAYINIFNYFLLRRRLEETGHEIMHSEMSRTLPFLAQPDAPFPVKVENLQDLVHDRKPTRLLKDFLLSCRFNRRRGNGRVWDHFSRSRAIFTLPLDYVLNAPHTQNQTSWLRYTSPEEWIGPPANGAVPPAAWKRIKECAEGYHDFALKYLQNRFGLQLPDRIADALRGYHKEYLNHIAVAYASIRGNVAKKRPKLLLTPTGGKTFTRALSLAVREHGGRVRGFPHGHFVCHSASPRPHVHEFATVDEFVVYTPALIPLFEKNVAAHPPPRKNAVRFISGNSEAYQRLLESHRHMPIPDRIRSVMVLELGLWADDVRYDVPETIVNYHFYYNLCKTLSDNGYEVIFKRRPKSWGWQGVNILAGIPNLKIVHDPFENPEVINMADAIVLQYGLSSTLVPALCTNKTLIYADAGWEPWFPEVYELIEKRCRVLRCWYDERNRQCFDSEELLGLLEKKPEPPNTEFLERYLLPE